MCLYTATQLLLGGDQYPRTTLETVFQAFGIFFGAIINANIFGELVVIMEGMGKDEKMFQAKLSVINTSMINLGLPEEL